MIATCSSSCDVLRGDHDAHAAHAEHPLDAVLAGEDLALVDARGSSGIALHWLIANSRLASGGCQAYHLGGGGDVRVSDR